VASFGVLLNIPIWWIGMSALGRYSASCWPAFLGLGVVVVKRPMVAALMLSGFALFQGVFFYQHMHQLFVM
jgi:hypothetical protein